MSRHTTIGSTRRSFVKSTVGVTGIGLVAGCTGDEPGGDGDPGTDPETEPGTAEPDFPTQDIRFIVPFGAGGGYDTYTRLAARHITKHLPGDVDVVVQNVGGAGGRIGTAEIYDADPDGYINGIINVSRLGREQIIEDIGFDIRDFEYYATLVFEHPMITVGHHVDVDDWDDFVEHMQAGELTFGTVGPASTTAFNAYIPGHVTGLWEIDDVIDNMVVYDGTAEMLPAILREDIDVLAVAVSSALTYVEDDAVKPVLFLSTDDPPADVADVQTLATAGVEDAQQIADMVPTRRSMAGPPDMPSDRVALWREAFDALLTDDDAFLSDAEEAGRPITYLDGEGTQTAVDGYVAGWEENQDLIELIGEV